MPPKRKRSKASAATPAKKKPAVNVEDDPTGSDPAIAIHELYRQCVLDGEKREQLDAIKELEEQGAIAETIWPFLAQNSGSKEFVHGCHLLVLFVAHHFWEGSFGSSSLDVIQEPEVIQHVLDVLLYKSEKTELELQTQIVNFLIVAVNSTNKILRDGVMKHVAGVNLLHWMPKRRMELELKKSAGLRRKFSDSTTKAPMWIVTNIQDILNLLEGNTEHGLLLTLEAHWDAADTVVQVPLDVWKFLHRSLELLTDLLSGQKSRFLLTTYLDSIHFGVRSRLAVGNRFAVPENLRLVQNLLNRINRLLAFPIEDGTQKHLSKVDVVSMRHSRATILQKMAYRYYPRDLQQVIYAGVGLLCTGYEKNSYLERAFVGFSDDEMVDLLFKLRLLPDDDKTVTREFCLQILGEFLAIPPYPLDQLKSFPLYPTERLLWDHSVIPPSSSQLRATQVLALPKLNAQFLSFQDYLLRNFELVRLESAYEIRADLVNVLKRVRPLLRQSSVEESEKIELTTEFNGWSRMALELAEPFALHEVQPPKLGETVSARVVAEIVVDLEPCGDAIRREWDEIGEFDNLFLLAVDASTMTGNPAPLLKDYHLRHGNQKVWDSDSEKRLPDDEDDTFPQRYGLTHVRGCMVLQVRNENDTVLSEVGAVVSDRDKKCTKRIFRVAMDTAQYAIDSKSRGGTDIYQGFNLVVRRHGRENNFRSILETIRGLMEGAGSIDRVIPLWLQSLILGNGDPASASYKSETIKSYAMKTVGVNKPNDFLDFGDTFLDEIHLRDSFSGKITVDGKEPTQAEGPRKKFKVRFSEGDPPGDETNCLVEAVSLPFPQAVRGNPIRFTPLQTEAIRAGLSPGLTMVVGPPGTGKTDVAVQIIACLYHSFPGQRTVIITHSNAALNDIFVKVMARGDVDERYLVRLGAGERDLETTSTHDFTKIGRVAYSIQRREKLLEEVQLMSESLGLSGKAQRGADGSPSYTCETADYFERHQINKRRRIFDQHTASLTDDDDVSALFPFKEYFRREKLTLSEAKNHLNNMDGIFKELAEYRPFELLRSQRQRADYLITKQAKVVAMTCTHAAIARNSLINLSFEYDNIVMEESGQMLEIESFIPMLLQGGKSDNSVSGLSRLKRVCMLGDHNQLPPVVKNASISKFSNLDQSLFSRLVGLGVPYIQLDKQGRARPELMKLYSWRYNNLGNLSHVSESESFKLANPGFVHTFQMINVEDFQDKGESTPTPYYYQNLGEAEYVVAVFQYMVLIGYDPSKISIITTYNGQKELISDIMSQRCGAGTPLEGVRPKAISTVDQYQGQQNDIILLSLVRTKTVGHLRDIRRLVVAVSRARLGLYVFCRRDIFTNCHELRNTMSQFASRPTKLQLVLGEMNPTERKSSDDVPKGKVFEVEDVSHCGSIVHSMQEDMLERQNTEANDE